MECYNHPDREAVNTCSVCGKSVCQECGMEIAGNVYCKDCVNDIVTQSITEKTSPEATQAPTEAEEIQVAEAPQTATEPETVEEIVEETEEIQEPEVPQRATEPETVEKIIDEPVETITPVKEDEVEEVIPIIPEKPAENYEADIEYETEYVETYDDDGLEDSYYENPEEIPEPEPEYMERERILEKEREEEKEIIEPVQAERPNINADMEEDYYQDIPNTRPSNELEAKYEKYLDDLYYDEEIEEEIYETPKVQRRQSRPRPQREEYFDEDYNRSPRTYSNQGEYYINPREEADEYYDDEYIVPAHGRSRARNDETESYEELKRRIERNYAMEQEAKQKRRFRRSKKQKRHEDFDELESIQEMHSYPEEYDEKEGIGIVDIILAIILIILIIALVLYVVYLFRLNGDYMSFIDSLYGLIQNPTNYLSNVMN